jgi:hypothetical protein
MNENPRMILSARRPGGEDDGEPEMVSALQTAKADPALAAWCEKQSAVDRSISRAFRSVQPPSDLRDSILTGARLSRRAAPAPAGSWFERRAFGFLRYGEVAAIAAVFALLAIAVIYNQFGQTPDDRTWQVFAAAKATEIESGVVQIEHEDPVFQSTVGWLRERACPVPDALPDGLRGLRLFGCSSVKWNGKPIGIVCFKLGEGQEVHLVTIDAAHIPDDLGSIPVWSEVAGFTSAQWLVGGTAHMLIGRATRAEMLPLIAPKTALRTPGLLPARG